MTGIHRISSLLLLLTFLLGCRQAPAPPPLEPQAEDIVPVWDDSVYCFNGRAIVCKDGLFGIVSTDGELVCPPVYDAIEFLNFDVALLSRYGTWFLATKDGRMMAENNDRAKLETGYEDLFDAVTRSDRVFWDGILDQYEAFCNACIDARLSSGAIGQVVSLREGIRAEMENARGRMTPLQKERFLEIRNRYYDWAR